MGPGQKVVVTTLIFAVSPLMKNLGPPLQPVASRETLYPVVPLLSPLKPTRVRGRVPTRPVTTNLNWVRLMLL